MVCEASRHARPRGSAQGVDLRDLVSILSGTHKLSNSLCDRHRERDTFVSGYDIAEMLPASNPYPFISRKYK
jgi:hypothetical protein